MPVTIAQVFDLLIALVIAMFIPIGLWRGALREWIALAGIALGTLVAAEWADPWGGELAVRTGMRPEMGAFLAGVALFLATVLLVGYGGGLALPYRPDLTRSNRLLGALLALGNGALILSGILRLMQRHLFGDQPDSLLAATGLTRFLVREIGWAQLLTIGALVVGVLIGGLRRWAGGPPLLEEFTPANYALDTSRAARAEAEEWEPMPEEGEVPDPAGASAAPAPGETAVLQLVPRAEPARPAPAAAPAPAAPPRRAPNTTLVSVPKVVEIARPQRAAPRLPANGHDPQATAPDEAATPAPPASANGTPVAAEAPSVAAPLELGAAGPTCPVCGQLAGVRSRFCQHCGHIIGEAEHRRVARHE